MRGPGAPTALGPDLATFQMGGGLPLAPGSCHPSAIRTAKALALAAGQRTPHGHTQENRGAGEAREDVIGCQRAFGSHCQHLPTFNFEAGPDHIMCVKDEKRRPSPCIRTVNDLFVGHNHELFIFIFLLNLQCKCNFLTDVEMLSALRVNKSLYICERYFPWVF